MYSDTTYTLTDNTTISSCNCMYQTEFIPQCQISGTGILDRYGYNTGLTGTWVGILIGIIAGYRILGWIVLAIRR